MPGRAFMSKLVALGVGSRLVDNIGRAWEVTAVDGVIYALHRGRNMRTKVVTCPRGGACFAIPSWRRFEHISGSVDVVHRVPRSA